MSVQSSDGSYLSGRTFISRRTIYGWERRLIFGLWDETNVKNGRLRFLNYRQ